VRRAHEEIDIICFPCKSARWPHAGFLAMAAGAQLAIRAVLSEFQPDAIWCRSAPVGLGIRRGGYKGCLIQIFCTNAKMYCRGYFLQTHGLPFMRRLVLLALWPLTYFILARIERELASACEAIAFSKNMYRQLLEAVSKRIRSCRVIPPGIDGGIFSRENGQRYLETIERKYGLLRGEQIILYVGRLASDKNIPMLMDAVTMLKQPKAKLVLVGRGPEEMRLNTYARRIGLSKRVVFAGEHCEMLPGFYAISRIFVLPTTIESFGFVYLEALSTGTPAIGFAGDGRRVLTATEEIIRDGKTGAVARTVSASALAEKIDSIMALDENNFDSMSRRARQDVRERFSWQRFVAETLALSV
jgi:glycosyltransferase involved in cell wall biosynthesis